MNDYRPLGDQTNNYLDKRFLQILDAGVNQIVINLKQHLGNDTEKVDNSAKLVLTALTDLQKRIKTNTDDLKIQTGNRAILHGDIGKGNISIDNTNFYNDVKKDINPIINTLDQTDKNLNIQGASTKLDLLDRDDRRRENNLNQIQTRLNNCQTLEVLYLRKHEELMKTFAFTINLFDKYKYSIKMILFLLKNLVDKRMPGEQEIKRQRESGIPRGIPGMVDLPKAIITNLGTMMKDQEVMQEVVNDMENVVKTKQQHNLGSLTNFGQDISLSQDIRSPTAIKP
jgi:hypothetical protein